MHTYDTLMRCAVCGDKWPNNKCLYYNLRAHKTAHQLSHPLHVKVAFFKKKLFGAWNLCASLLLIVWTYKLHLSYVV